MRTLTAMAALAITLTAGCSLFRSGDDPLPPVPADPNRIEIMCSLANPGAPPAMIKLVVEKGKVGSAMITSGFAMQGNMLPLPPETFEQCQALLAKTDFFHMRSAVPGGGQKIQSRSIYVIHNGHEHAVGEYPPARASAEFEELMQFILSRTRPSSGP
jgi:hypothetical protein